MRSLTVLTVVAGLVLGATAVQAQSLDLGGRDGGPIEVEADNGIEWVQGEKRFVARGNAVATRGDVVVRGDSLTAWYREAATGGNEVYRLEADGGVTITSPREQATGEHAVFNVDTGVMVLTPAPGKVVTLVTPEDTVVAREKLTYDTRKRLATAEGGAKVTQQGKNTLTGTTLVAKMEEVDGKTQMRTVDAYGNVVVTTPTETARGSQGKYDARTGIAVLTGSVTLEKDKNVLTGSRAVVNTKSGVSKLYAGDAASGDGRARAVLVPKDDDAEASGTAEGRAGEAVEQDNRTSGSDGD